jgi:hypothetical protein
MTKKCKQSLNVTFDNTTVVKNMSCELNSPFFSLLTKENPGGIPRGEAKESQPLKRLWLKILFIH